VRARLALAAVLALGGVAVPPGHAATRPPVTVRFGEFFFRPATVTVHVGQAVRFVDVGRIEHTVADTTAGWKTVRSRLIVPRPLAHGQAQTVRFTRPGTVWYLCTFHPTLMRGKVVVVP
jgi:plastocyanin